MSEKLEKIDDPENILDGLYCSERLSDYVKEIGIRKVVMMSIIRCDYRKKIKTFKGERCCLREGLKEVIMTILKDKSGQREFLDDPDIKLSIYKILGVEKFREKIVPLLKEEDREEVFSGLAELNHEDFLGVVNGLDDINLSQEKVWLPGGMEKVLNLIAEEDLIGYLNCHFQHENDR